MNKKTAAKLMRTTEYTVTSLITRGIIRADKDGNPWDCDVYFHSNKTPKREIVIYARTISHQSTLANQIETLQSRFKTPRKVYSDIAEGKTLCRDGLLNLIRDISKYKVSEIHVTRWDRILYDCSWFREWLKQYDCRVIEQRKYKKLNELGIEYE